jgi:type II secretory pathway component PulM
MAIKNLNKLKNSQVLENILEKIKPHLKSAEIYWKNLAEREQQIVKIGGVSLVLMFVFLIVNSMMHMETNLKSTIRTDSINLANARILKIKMQDLSSITSNEFTSVSAEKVRGDITQLFEIKEPDVALNDNVLIINIPNVKFDLVMLFLDQLRKSYGIFPNKLKIYRANQSSFVNLYATFNIEE